MIMPPSEGSERILKMQLSTSSGLINLFSLYAPTLLATKDKKNQFYDQLDEALKGVSPSEAIYVLGDFNTRVSPGQTLLDIMGLAK